MSATALAEAGHSWRKSLYTKHTPINATSHFLGSDNMHDNASEEFDTQSSRDSHPTDQQPNIQQLTNQPNKRLQRLINSHMTSVTQCP